MKVEGLDKLKKKLEHLAKVHYDSPNKADNSVIVGYTAAYALWVHEAPMSWKGVQRDPREREPGSLGGPKYRHMKNPRTRKRNPKGKFWDPAERGQNKFLEQPARELNNNGTLGNIITDAVKRGVKLQKALVLAGLRIQRESQKLVPVDTANLKASAFTKAE